MLPYEINADAETDEDDEHKLHDNGTDDKNFDNINEWQRGKSPTTSTAAGFKLETARASNQDTVPLSRRTIFHCKNADSGSNAEQKTVWSCFFFFNVNTLKCHFRERSSLSTTRRRSRCWWSG